VWCWRKMEVMCWTDCVRNEEELQTVKEVKDILHVVKGREAAYLLHT
jgi:hypothetical protein